MLAPPGSTNYSANKFTDNGLANRTIEILRSHKRLGVGANGSGRPFFHAVGFIRPHLDWSSPPEFWAHYPIEKCVDDVAKYKTAPSGSPKIAWVDGGYADHKQADCGRNCKDSTAFSPELVSSTSARLARRLSLPLPLHYRSFQRDDSCE